MTHKAVGKNQEKEGKAKTPVSDQIKDLEDELSKTKYNKATQHHIGLVKAKIARLREKQEARGKSGKKGEGYSVKKSGEASVVLLGFPSVGKSTLLNSLTNADSPVGDYAFTTLTVIPGIMEYKHAKIQILDVPGIVKGASSGTGRGKEVLQVIRNADFVIILLDVFHPEQYDVIKKEVYNSKVRLNQKPPDVRITKKGRGGIQIGKTVLLPDLNEGTIRSILKEFKISNASVLIRERINADEFIDVVQKNRTYSNSITVLNKIDMVSKEYLQKIKKMIKPDVCVSAEKNENIDELKEKIFEGLEFIRVYCKEVGKPADIEVPVIIKKNSTVEDFANKLHKDFASKFRFSKVWGKSAKFPGQKKSLGHRILDQDVVEIHIR